MYGFIEVDKLIQYANNSRVGIDANDIARFSRADVVEVVRCKDCKWQDKGKNECESWNMCRHNVIEYFAIYDEHFCAWGERREDEREL